MELKNVSIEREKNEYMIKIGSKVLLSTWAQRQDEQELKNWLSKVGKIYGNKKNKKPPVVGLSTDRSSTGNYANKRCGSSKDGPYELLQLCVGNHCLLWEIKYEYWGFWSHQKGYKVSKQPKELKDFLENNKIMVVGVNINNTVEKIEKETDLLIPKTRDLRELAAEQEMENKGEFAKCKNVSALARLILGENMVFAKPNKLSWYSDTQYRPFDYSLSDEVVKLASIEAFLAAEMGSKLLAH